MVKNAMKSMGEPAEKLYLCGPESMMHLVSDTLVDLGVEKSKIMFELFASTSSKVEIKNLKEVTSLEIIYDDLTHKIENIKGQSLLEAALQNKLDVPYSCQGGVCSSCIARIKSGTAEMASNQILTKEEVEEGLVLTCQANATSAHLVVDYDDV